ncbi:MAG: hypothetical protein ABIP53_02195 [Candidatus Limnocylindrales bacterium]
MPELTPTTPPIEDDAEFYRWYGHWRSPTPRGVARVMRGSNVHWWVIGGWAIEAFTGIRREHEDIDVSFFRADLPALLDHLSPRYCVWSNYGGVLKPLRKPDDLLDGSRQLWVRRDAGHQWMIDLAMNPHDGDTWISVRDDSIRMPITEATFEKGGINYLQPQIVLAMKARWARTRDDGDLGATLPLLDEVRRRWLHDTIEHLHPGHRWLAQIGATA